MDSRQWFGFAIPFYPQEPSEWEGKWIDCLSQHRQGLHHAWAAAEKQRMKVGWNGGLGAGCFPFPATVWALPLPHCPAEAFLFLQPGIPPALMELSLLLQRSASRESLTDWSQGGRADTQSSHAPPQLTQWRQWISPHRWLSAHKECLHSTCPTTHQTFLIKSAKKIFPIWR